MNAVVPFAFEGKEVRTRFDNNAEPSFCGVDVCRALEHSNPSKAMTDHVDPEDITSVMTPTAGGKQIMKWVNESGLYALTFGARTTAAKRFRRWVTHEVLPALRKTGRYETPTVPRQKTKFFSMRIGAERAERLALAAEKTGLKKTVIMEQAFDQWMIKLQVEDAERERLIAVSKQYLLSRPIH